MFTTITLGGYIFGFNYLNFADPIECDFELLDAAGISEIQGYFGQISTVETCYEFLPKILAIVDIDNNRWIDRCDSARFLHSAGNTIEYSLKYSHNLPFSMIDRRCDQLFNPLYA